MSATASFALHAGGIFLYLQMVHLAPTTHIKTKNQNKKTSKSMLN